MKTFSAAIDLMQNKTAGSSMATALRVDRRLPMLAASCAASCAASLLLSATPAWSARTAGGERVVVAGLGSLIFRDSDKDKSNINDDGRNNEKPAQKEKLELKETATPASAGDPAGQRIRIEMPDDTSDAAHAGHGEDMHSIIVPQTAPRTEAPAAVAPATAPESVTSSSHTRSMPEPEPSFGQVTASAQAAEIVGGTDERTPSFLPDTAFISVLRDVSRSLKEPAELAKLEDPSQRAVVALAQSILAKALAAPDLSADRIVHDRNRSMASMTTEAWASGDVKLSERCRGSLSAVWAKHDGGLLNLTIAGECNDRNAPNGRKIGEFVVFIAAKSPVEKGFDIQTQSEVHFWIAKLSSISVESTSATASKVAADIPGAAPETASPSRPPIVLQPVVTQRGRQYMAQVESYNSQHESNDAVAGNANIVRSTAHGTTIAAAAPAAPTAPASSPAGQAARRPGKPAAPVDRVSLKTIMSEANAAQNPSLDSIKQPSATAKVVIPDRAIAGQPLTASVVGAGGVIEPVVALDINGVNVYTDKRGLALYMVPDDAEPGKSLRIGLAARSDANPATVDILQPLSVPSEQQPPRMDRILIAGGNRFAIIEGHNFEGYAQLNRVTLDNQYDAKVLASSPVQIKILLPQGIQPGVHTISFTVSGLKSTAVAFKILPVQTHRTAARD